jgi:thiol-disulfide isomerase/thioredoxin
MRKVLVIALLMSAIIVTSCQKTDRFFIQGNFANIPDGTKIELIPGATLKEEKPIAEAIVKNGLFTFEDSVPEPRLFYLMIQDGAGGLNVLVENGNRIEITGQPIREADSISVYYDFRSMKVKGSAINDEFQAKMAFRKELDSIYDTNSKLGEEVNSKLNIAHTQNNKALLDSLQNTKAYKELMEREKIFMQKSNDYCKNAVMSNMDSWWGPLLILNIYTYLDEEQKEWYKQFPENVKQSYYGQIVKKNLPRESWVGKAIPDFAVIKNNGSKASFKEIVAGKKYYLLDFWASWCGPCKEEIPNLKNLYKKYASKGFEIVSISIDADSKAWMNAVKEHGLTWPNFRDVDNSIAGLYEVKFIPTMFSIDGSGKIVLDNKRGEELAAKLEELFK